jgi:FkbM family methyltransferase
VLGDLGKYLVRMKWSFPSNLLLSRYLAWSELREALDQLRINCVFDVGANTGQFAMGLRKIGYTGWIISYEPSPGDFAAMSRAFGGDPRWRGYQIALGSEGGTSTFNVTLGDSRLSSFLSLRRPDFGVETIQVEVKRLDAVFEEALGGIKEPRVFLKMDTQGFDLKVIEGASGCVDRVLGLLSEISAEASYNDMPSYLDSLKVYEGLGFRLKGLSEIAWNRARGTLVEMDCLMIRNTLTVEDSK